MKLREMQASPLIMLSPSSPSFNSYSSPPEDLADIAARVVQEFKNKPDSEEADIFCWQEEELQQQQQEAQETKYCAEEENKIYYERNRDQYDDDGEEEEEEEEEFSFVCNKESDSSPILADKIFYNGQIRPIYPLFNTSLVFNQESEIQPNALEPKAFVTTKKIRLPLRKLFDEERETATSCSSSESDEIECLPPGTYCVWKPKKVVAEKSPDKCKKSNSTGSSKRWKLRDLVCRSNSDGKEKLVFFNARERGITVVEEHLSKERRL